MVKLGLSIDEGGEGGGGEEELPPLEEEGQGQGSRMEEVD
jgi:hypothetical protein